MNGRARFWILDRRGKVSRGEDKEQITHNPKSKIQNPKLTRPWERYLETPTETRIISPSAVQRDFQRIISEIGKTGNSSKPYGIAPGRVTGQRILDFRFWIREEKKEIGEQVVERT